jgi:hypothetical protein
MPAAERRPWHARLAPLRHDRQLWVEAFTIFNFAALVGDIYLAHSENAFRRSSEYIPLVFSAVAAVALLAALPFRGRGRLDPVWRFTGHVIGWCAVAVGLAGTVLHLDSHFFYERTIRSLTYAAPFAAPLAYAGLGLLLIANRMLPVRSRQWAEWMLLLALGGFVGNFVFSLTDHAMNGFFHAVEWIPVISAAAAIGFLVVPFFVAVDRRFLRQAAIVLAVQALVGLAGFVLHARADLLAPNGTLFERVTSGAPPLAPMLFVNLALLAGIAIDALWPHVPERLAH